MIVAVVFLFSAVVSLIQPGPVSSPRAFAKQSSLRSNLLIWNDLCLANCYFAHDSSGFPILLLFFDAQSGRSCYPLDRHAGSVARTWWRPFPGRGVASPETPAPQELVTKSFQIKKTSQTSSWHKRRVEDAVRADRESLPATIAQSIRGGPSLPPCWRSWRVQPAFSVPQLH